MSFYVAKTNSLKTRHVDLLAYQLNSPFEKGNKIFDYLLDKSNKIEEDDFFERNENRLFEIRTKPNGKDELKSIYKKIISFAIEKNFETIEIGLLSVENLSQEETYDISIKFLEEYLEDKDISVGLLIYDDGSRDVKCLKSFAAPKFKARKLASKKDEKITENQALLYEFKPFELEESFYEKLLRYLSNSKKTNAEIYQDGGLTRQVFSKIISSELYCPKKNTIICLIIGLELDLDDALTLLESAGYTLSSSILFDSLIKDFLGEGCYNIDTINDALNEHNLPLLGWKPR